MATISRIFVRLGLPYLTRGRKRAPRPRQLKLFEKPNPEDSVQVDVKVVKPSGRKAYQYTAIDDCTRFRVLRLYRELNQRSSVDFLAEVRRALPFLIHQLQCDNGTEFSLAFALTVQEAGIKLRYIRPRCHLTTRLSRQILDRARTFGEAPAGTIVDDPKSQPDQRRTRMPQYLYQVAYTAESLAAQIKNPQDRLELVGKQLADAVGAKILAGGYSFGEYDISIIVEAADDITMAAVAVAIAAGGAVKAAKTTPLLSGPQWVTALKKAPAVTAQYRPAR